MALGMEAGLCLDDFVLDGDPAPPPQNGGGAPSTISAHFWATVCKTVRPVLSDRCPVCLSYPVCDVGVLWPNG